MDDTRSPDAACSSAPPARDTAAEWEDLVRRMAGCPPGRERDRLREAAITALLPVARRIARRYGCPRDSREDLFQVACVGLVKAINRFDPERGRDFLSYAVPTIDGELKRHLRDHTWEVHVPRRIQEGHRRVRFAQEELQRAGDPRGGSVRDIHRLTGMEETEIRLVLQADRARNPLSIDERRDHAGESAISDTLGSEDPNIEFVTELIALRPLVRELPDRERRILRLYFLNALTQRQVAALVGVSQMHVSRLLSQACATLRQALLAS